MTHVEWQIKQVEALIGATIVGAAQDDENEAFGLILKKGGKQVVAWVLMDPEGNGPGTLDIQQLEVQHDNL